MRHPLPHWTGAILALGTLAGPAPSWSAGPPAPAPWTIQAPAQEPGATAALEEALKAGRTRIEEFFGQPFEKPFTVRVFPGREELDAYFQERWQLPKTECWMVAAGVADTLAILAPSVWGTQSCEHDPKDPDHLREIVAHELVHVYHGQHNPRPDFDDMDDVGWFVEGLAVHVSGQLERGHRDAAGKAIAEGKAPARLAEAWSGRYRYGVAGSLVRLLDERWGRGMLWKLLPAVTQEEILGPLGLSEGELLAAWRERVALGSGVTRRQ